MKNKKIKLIALAGVTVTTAVMLTGCGKNDVKTYDKDQINVNIAETTDQNTVIENNVNQNNNQEQDSENVEALKAIATALKDKSWIQENIFTDWENLEYEQQELTFICLKKDSDEIPIIIVNCFIEGDVYNKATLVTYDGGKIKTETICDGYMRFLEVDPNNKILTVTDYHMGRITYSYLKVESKSLSSIEWISEPMEDNDEITGYYYGTGNESNEITKEEFDGIKNKYNGYNFVSIGTDLTDENIDKYIYKVEISDKNTNREIIDISTENKMYCIALLNDFESVQDLTTEDYLGVVHCAINRQYIELENQNKSDEYKPVYTEEQISNVVYSLFNVNLKEHKTIHSGFVYKNGYYTFSGADGEAIPLIKNINEKTENSIEYDLYMEDVWGNQEYKGKYKVELNKSNDGNEFIVSKKQIQQ